jgi:hypothetical protein
LDDVDVIQFDDLVQREYEVSAGSAEVGEFTWLEMIRYWISEMRWRRKFWLQSRD